MNVDVALTIGRGESSLPFGLDFNDDRFLAQASSGQSLSPAITQAALVVLFGAAIYGWTFGLWRSPWLALYVAIKLPVLLVLTTSMVLVFNWLLAHIMGSGLGIAQVAALTYRAMAVACLVLVSLSPVSAFLAISCPQPRPYDDLSHNLLLLLHVLFVMGAGVYGNRVTLNGLHRLSRPGTPIKRLHFSWLATNAFVGGQLAWIMRPFLGSPNYPVAFLRPDALEGNFYEFVFVTIVWKRLLAGG